MEEDKKELEHAFPLTDGHTFANNGMTLRDYFAAKAMKYFISANNGNFSENDASQIFYIADTMLKQREP